jgi:hypothetical protein
MPNGTIFCPRKKQRGPRMLDIAYITLALVSFALFALAVEGCERL